MESKTFTPTDTLDKAFVGEAEEKFKANPYQFKILVGLNRLGKHIYGGTVPAAEIAKRRAKNKVARASRRKNRG